MQTAGFRPRELLQPSDHYPLVAWLPDRPLPVYNGGEVAAMAGHLSQPNTFDTPRRDNDAKGSDRSGSGIVGGWRNRG